MHGAHQTAQVVAASQALFGRGDLRELDGSTVDAALAEVPRPTVDLADRPTIVDLLVATGLAESRGAARRTVDEGGAYVNNVKVDGRPVGAGRAATCCTAGGSSSAGASATSPASGSSDRPVDAALG